MKYFFKWATANLHLINFFYLFCILSYLASKDPNIVKNFDRSPIPKPILESNILPSPTRYKTLDSILERALIPEQIYVSEGPKKRRNSMATSTGTAWSIDSKGNWATAEHVVNDCATRTLLDIPPLGQFHGDKIQDKRSKVPRKVTFAPTTNIHSTADIAMLLTGKKESFLTLGDDPPISINNKAITSYGYGFPGGDPGEVILELLGKTNAIRSSKQEAVHVWSVKTSNPSRKSFSGISGGPVLNTKAEVIGMLIFGNDRRGRLYSSKASTIKKFFNDKNIQLTNNDEEIQKITEKNYIEIGEYLRSSKTIARVICVG